MKRVWYFYAGVAFMSLVMGGAARAEATTVSSGTQVAILGGTLQGASSDGVDSFKGIPYAAPPVGPLRWTAPQPAASWKGTLGAKAFKPDCAQQPFPFDSAPSAGGFSEDGCNTHV